MRPEERKLIVNKAINAINSNDYFGALMHSRKLAFTFEIPNSDSTDIEFKLSKYDLEYLKKQSIKKLTQGCYFHAIFYIQKLISTSRDLN